MTKEKEELIIKLKEKNIDFNPQMGVERLKGLLDGDKEPETFTSGDEEALKGTNTDTPIKPDGDKGSDKQLELLQAIHKNLQSLDGRISTLEGKPSSEYKGEALSQDIERASSNKDKLDPKVVSIVEEVLGTDFGIEMNTFADKPGFLFTVIVPQRLSDNVSGAKPALDENGGYRKDEAGNVIMEPYFPEDRRSKAIGSADSYAAIRDHCEKVRSYIVSYYTKLKKPLPEFKYKV